MHDALDMKTEMDKVITTLKGRIWNMSMPESPAQIHKDTLLWLVYLLEQTYKKYTQQDFPADWDPITMYEWWYQNWLNLISDIILKYNEVVELARNLNIKKWK